MNVIKSKKTHFDFSIISYLTEPDRKEYWKSFLEYTEMIIQEIGFLDFHKLKVLPYIKSNCTNQERILDITGQWGFRIYSSIGL